MRLSMPILYNVPVVTTHCSFNQLICFPGQSGVRKIEDTGPCAF